MSIEEAREIFGDKFKYLSDVEVQDFITNMGILCDGILDDAIYQLTSNKNNSNTKIRLET